MNNIIEFQDNIFSKSELLFMIKTFDSHKHNLLDPMVSWAGDGAYESAEAILQVNDGLIPDGIVFCARKSEDHEWESVYIFKAGDGSYIIDVDQFSSGIKSETAVNVNTAIPCAVRLLTKLIELN